MSLLLEQYIVSFDHGNLLQQSKWQLLLREPSALSLLPYTLPPSSGIAVWFSRTNVCFDVQALACPHQCTLGGTKPQNSFEKSCWAKLFRYTAFFRAILIVRIAAVLAWSENYRVLIGLTLTFNVCFSFFASTKNKDATILFTVSRFPTSCTL